MRLTFLGTAAAEGFPALWCRCERCTVARQRGGRNNRFRSAVLVNDDLLLDFGPDLVASAIRFNLDLSGVRTLLLTHPHHDHLDPTNFFWRRKGFCPTELETLDVYLSKVALETLVARAPGEDLASCRAHFQTVAPFQQWYAGPDRHYHVWSFAARHARLEMESMLLAVRDRRSGRAFFYATDTGPFPDATWDALERLKEEPDGQTQFHAVSVDSTYGLSDPGSSHMSVPQAVEHMAELDRRGLLAPGAARICHHFSHNGTPPYEELVAFLAPQGVETAYDGMVVDVR